MPEQPVPPVSAVDSQLTVQLAPAQRRRLVAVLTEMMSAQIADQNRTEGRKSAALLP